MSLNDVLDESEVAKILDCEPLTVQVKARSGELPAIKFGRSWRFPRAALLQYLNDLALTNKPKHPVPLTFGVTPDGAKSRRRKRPVLNPI
jgi:excisionase family DNA binding protein